MSMPNIIQQTLHFQIENYGWVQHCSLCFWTNPFTSSSSSFHGFVTYLSNSVWGSLSLWNLAENLLNMEILFEIAKKSESDCSLPIRLAILRPLVFKQPEFFQYVLYNSIAVFISIDLLLASTLQPTMSYTTINTPYTLFPTSPSSPNAFSLFTYSQSPRDTHVTYEDLRQVLRPSNRRPALQKKSVRQSSVKFGLKKLLGGN